MKNAIDRAWFQLRTTTKSAAPPSDWAQPHSVPRRGLCCSIRSRESQRYQKERSVITLPASAIRPEAADPTGGRLHGMTMVPNHVQEEQPYHRLAAGMLALGVPVDDVAAQLDVGKSSVTQWMREPWFQERVLQLQEKWCGSKDFKKLIESEALSSFATLVEIRSDKTTPKALRASISQDILNRHLGKPIARSEVHATVVSGDPVAEVQKLEEQVAQLRKSSVN